MARERMHRNDYPDRKLTAAEWAAVPRRDRAKLTKRQHGKRESITMPAAAASAAERTALRPTPVRSVVSAGLPGSSRRH